MDFKELMERLGADAVLPQEANICQSSRNRIFSNIVTVRVNIPKADVGEEDAAFCRQFERTFHSLQPWLIF